MRNERIQNSAKPFGPLRSFLAAIAIATMGCSDTCSARSLVLVAADTAPTAYMEDGKPTGILVDVVTEAFRRTGYQFEIQLMPWAR
jgi:polar amino acid transport system substrate-binding protein